MISNYNLSCDYHNFELKDKIYLIPDWALKVIYTDGFNEVVFSGNSANVTILEGYDISFQEETSFDERFKFSKSVSIKVNGYKTFNDLDYRYCVVLETKEGEFYLVNVDFPSFVTHTYTLNNGTNSTELVFSSQSNIATLKLTNFEPINVNLCKEYSIPKIKNVKLTEAWASYLSTWQKSLVNKGEFVDIEPLPDSISLTEEFDGEKYTVTLGFDIPMSYYKNDWHIKLLQFEENKYRGYISLENGNKAFVGYNVGLFPSYTINGDIISIRLTETAIRGIAYGNDYVLIDTDIPNTIEYNGASCYTYNWLSTCDWHVVDKPDYITISPTSGQADTQYELTICNTDDETGYAVSEFTIKTCNARVRHQVIVENPIYRWVSTEETMCVVPPTPTFDGKFKLTLNDSSTVSAECDSTSAVTQSEVSTQYSGTVVSAEIGDCATNIGFNAFYKCSGLTSVTISDSVTSIGSQAFIYCSGFASIDIPNSVTSIGDWAFYECSGLTSIDIPNSVMSVDENTFGFCTSLSSVTIGNGVTSIGSWTFNHCYSLTAVTLGNSITSIGEYAFYFCYSLTSIDIPNSVTSIGGSAFENCTSLSSVTIGSGVTSIGGSAFYGCSGLTSIDIPNSVTTIGGSAFYECSGLTSCTIGSGVTSIGGNVFRYCISLTNINIPSGVTSIGQKAFDHCRSLSNVNIPSGVTSIGNYAFYYCSGLTSVTVNATTPPTTLGDHAFDGSTCPIYVPSASVNTYKSASGWRIYASRIQAIP